MSAEWRVIAAFLITSAVFIALGWWLLDYLDEWMGE